MTAVGVRIQVAQIVHADVSTCAVVHVGAEEYVRRAAVSAAQTWRHTAAVVRIGVPTERLAELLRTPCACHGDELTER